MSMIQILGAVQIGLIYGIVAIGVYLSFRVLDFPDLSVDGTFPMGAAISGIMIINGHDPLVATGFAMVGGALAGIFTAWLNVQWGILNLLASILTSIGLYSLNLRIMGNRPNIAILNESTLITSVEDLFRGMGLEMTNMNMTILFLFIVVTLITLLTYVFLSTQTGLAMRATGKNPRMATAQGIRTGSMVVLGIALSNAIVALAGALFTQIQGFADVTMGVGTIIVGLAAVLIGEAIFSAKSLLIAISACVVGSIIYRELVALALNADFIGLQASDLQLVTALLVAVAMMLSHGRKRLNAMFSRKGRAS
ncbi:MAG: ABC transporter permease [Alphaproteobacteria bacterium]